MFKFILTVPAPEIQVKEAGPQYLYMEKEKELVGGSESTTNNRMELSAVIEALKALKEPCEVKHNRFKICV